MQGSRLDCTCFNPLTSLAALYQRRCSFVAELSRSPLLLCFSSFPLLQEDGPVYRCQLLPSRRCCTVPVSSLLFTSALQKCDELYGGYIKQWASGKEGNLRALLSTLQFVSDYPHIALSWYAHLAQGDIFETESTASALSAKSHGFQGHQCQHMEVENRISSDKKESPVRFINSFLTALSDGTLALKR